MGPRYRRRPGTGHVPGAQRYQVIALDIPSTPRVRAVVTRFAAALEADRHRDGPRFVLEVHVPPGTLVLPSGSAPGARLHARTRGAHGTALPPDAADAGAARARFAVDGGDGDGTRWTVEVHLGVPRV